MIIGLIPCTMTKAPDTALLPAWLRYLPSPSFRAQFETAKAACDEIRIISGKFGVLKPSDEIPFYDQSIKRASAADVTSWRDRLATEGGALKSYLPKDYRVVLHGLEHEQVTDGDLYALAKARSTPSGAANGTTLPIVAVVTWAYLNSGATEDDLKAFIATRYAHPVTQSCQFNRIYASGWFRREGNRFFYNKNHPCDI